MTSTDTLLQSHRICTRRRKPDGVIASYLLQPIPLHRRGIELCNGSTYSTVPIMVVASIIGVLIPPVFISYSTVEYFDFENPSKSSSDILLDGRHTVCRCPIG